MPLTALEFARMLDCTLTHPTATLEEVYALVAAAKKYHIHTVLGPRCFNELIAQEVQGTDTLPCSGCSATLGHDPTEVKVFHAKLAVSQGMREIDMVMNLCYLKSGMYEDVVRDLRSVKEAVGQDVPLKCIIEAPLLDDGEIATASKLAVEGGVDFVKTASGLRGATTVHHVEVIRQAIGSAARIKAASGIRDAETVEAMVEAGVDRFGISLAHALNIIRELEGEPKIR